MKDVRNSRKLQRRRYRIIAEKSRFKCWYCGLDARKMNKVTRDHQVPKSRGGLKTADNLVLACERCNREKADMDVETYRWFLQDKRAAGIRVVFYGERVPQPWYA